MASDAGLSPPTPAERLARIARFTSEERRYHVHMRERDSEQAAYWQERIAQCDAALEDVAALAGSVT